MGICGGFLNSKRRPPIDVRAVSCMPSRVSNWAGRSYPRRGKSFFWTIPLLDTSPPTHGPAQCVFHGDRSTGRTAQRPKVAGAEPITDRPARLHVPGWRVRQDRRERNRTAFRPVGRLLLRTGFAGLDRGFGERKGRREIDVPFRRGGRVWLNAPVLKTGRPFAGLGGSNPSPSACFFLRRLGGSAGPTSACLSGPDAPCACPEVTRGTNALLPCRCTGAVRLLQHLNRTPGASHRS